MSEPGADPSAWPRRLRVTLREEFAQLRPRQHLLSLVSRLLPYRTGNTLRASLLRWRGISVGVGTLVLGTPELTGGEAPGFSALSIGSHCRIDVGCAFELGDALVIGDHVRVGYQVLILTTTHELGPRHHRAGPLVRAPVRIEDGVVIGARSIILPGVTVGSGAVVEPASVVNKSVAPRTRVGGVPARLLEDPAP